MVPNKIEWKVSSKTQRSRLTKKIQWSVWFFFLIFFIERWSSFVQITEVRYQIEKMLNLLTAVLNEHLIVGQQYLIDSDRAFFSLNKTQTDSLSNFQLSFPEHGHINLSASRTSASSSTILTRVRLSVVRWSSRSSAFSLVSVDPIGFSGSTLFDESNEFLSINFIGDF